MADKRVSLNEGDKYVFVAVRRKHDLIKEGELHMMLSNDLTDEEAKTLIEVLETRIAPVNTKPQ